MLDVGTIAPPFTAQNHQQRSFELADQRGRWLLLWWYPKASTPG